MTPLNTIIEEEEKVARRLFDLTLDCKLVPKDIEDAITTAMQRAYEAGQSEERAKCRTALDQTYREHVTEDDRQRLHIEVIFSVRQNPGSVLHLREVLRSYLAPKGIELQDDLTIEI